MNDYMDDKQDSEKKSEEKDLALDHESHWRMKIHEIFSEGFCKERLEEFLSVKRNDFVMEHLLQNILANKNKKALHIMMACISKKWKEDFGDNTITVWLGSDYRGLKTGEKTLVCFHSDDIESKLLIFLNLPVIYRTYEETEMEPQQNRLQSKYQSVSFNKNDAATIKDLISELGENLFRNHSNLEIISAGSVKSTKTCIIEQTSILLYCRLKGVIPYWEDFFPKDLRLNDTCYPTDIREGYFSLGMFHPQRRTQTSHPQMYNESLRMGCSIGTKDSECGGTLGPFVRLNISDTNNIGFLTCAHVVGIINSKGKLVVQPANVELDPQKEDCTCGTVFEERFDPHAKVGIDAAIVCIDRTKRNIHLGSFAWMDKRQLSKTGFKIDEEPSFEKGKVIMEPKYEELHDKSLIKSGRTTGLTKGKFVLEGMMLRIHAADLSLPNELPSPDGYSSKTFTMKGQFLVESHGKGRFFDEGDSGAGVYVLNYGSRGKLALVGIAIGYLSSGECVMTPIGHILTALGLEESSIITQTSIETV